MPEPIKIRKPRAKREAPPAPTPEAREKQLVNLAVELAEKQLRDGTASPSIINHYLKLASNRETLERDILARQAALIDAKVSSIHKSEESEKLAQKAVEAMRNYNTSS